MKLQLLLFSILSICVSGLSLQAMELEPSIKNELENRAAHQSTKLSSIPSLHNYVAFKKLFLELTALLSSDSIPTQEALIPLLATIRYEKLPELFAVEKSFFTRCFKLKKLQSFFKHYRVRTSQERMASFTACLEFTALEEFFGCPSLKEVLNLCIELWNCTGTAEEKQQLADRLQPLIKNIIEISAQRKSSGVTKSALITTYFDCTFLLTLINNLAQGNEVSYEHCLELCNGNELLMSYDIPHKEYSQYCSIAKLLRFIVTSLKQGAPSLEGLITCLHWDVIGELIAEELLAEDIDTLISREKLRQMMRNLQAQKPITGEELYALIVSKELKLYLTLKQFDWNECAQMLNELRQGTVEKSTKQSIENIAQLLELDIAGATDTSLPEEVQAEKIQTLVDRVTNSDWYIRGKYALPLVGTLVTGWLAGHTFCHSCMEFFEPQNWYTAGPLAFAAAYTTVRLGKFFTGPETIMKSFLVNTILTKGTRFFPFLRKEGITKDDIKSRAPQDKCVQGPFSDLIDLVSYAQLDTLPDNRYRLLELFENPFMFASQCSSFIEALFHKESHQTQETYEKTLMAFYALLNTTLPQEKLPYYSIYNEFMQSFNEGPSKKDLASSLILKIACYNPLLLIGQPGFVKAINESEVCINKIPLSGWFLTLLNVYKQCMQAQEIETAERL